MCRIVESRLACIVLVLDIVNGLANSLDFVCLLVWYQNGEFVFNLHNHLCSVKRVISEILAEGRGVGDGNVLCRLAVRLQQLNNSLGNDLSSQLRRSTVKPNSTLHWRLLVDVTWCHSCGTTHHRDISQGNSGRIDNTSEHSWKGGGLVYPTFLLLLVNTAVYVYVCVWVNLSKLKTPFIDNTLQTHH